MFHMVTGNCGQYKNIATGHACAAWKGDSIVFTFIRDLICGRSGTGLSEPADVPDMEIDDNGMPEKYTGQEEIVIIPDGVKEIGGPLDMETPYERPKEYQELYSDDLKFYYRSEKAVDREEGCQEEDVLKDYGLRFDHKFKDDYQIYKKNGKKVLMIYVSVPTFDSGDREWDSYRKLFLIPQKKTVEGFMIAGGYKVSKIFIYEDMRCADSRTEKILKNAGIL